MSLICESEIRSRLYDAVVVFVGVGGKESDGVSLVRVIVADGSCGSSCRGHCGRRHGKCGDRGGGGDGDAVIVIIDYGDDKSGVFVVVIVVTDMVIVVVKVMVLLLL